MAPQIGTAQRRAERLAALIMESIRPVEECSRLTNIRAIVPLITETLRQASRDALEDAAKMVNIYNCDHNHGKKATKACDDIAEMLDRLREGREG